MAEMVMRKMLAGWERKVRIHVGGR